MVCALHGPARVAVIGSLAAQRDSKVLRLGEPGLRALSVPVDDVLDSEFVQQARGLGRVLEQFRRREGFGRAIAAPQIGVERRFIAVNLGHGPFVVVNPEITWRSQQLMTLWDDCMSFPSLMVKVRRSKSISVRYTTENGEEVVWDRLNPPEAELLQHEIDHLDGILAVDRALDGEALVDREVFDTHRSHFEAQVDYVIQPTIAQR